MKRRHTGACAIPTLKKGRYRARWAETPADLCAAQALRWLAFKGRGVASADSSRDIDGFDPFCRHMLVEHPDTGATVATFRVMPFADSSEIGQGYAAQFYDLTALQMFKGRMAEMGRFCLHPDRHDPDILRISWGALTQYVDQTGVELLFGCTSFAGADATMHQDAFAAIQDRHMAPKCWRPREKAAHIYRFAGAQRGLRPEPARAKKALPPLLRTYLSMGGWVSDHAVIDRDMGTLHVFTGLEIAAIPATRARLLRQLAD